MAIGAYMKIGELFCRHPVIYVRRVADPQKWDGPWPKASQVTANRVCLLAESA